MKEYCGVATNLIILDTGVSTELALTVAEKTYAYAKNPDGKMTLQPFLKNETYRLVLSAEALRDLIGFLEDRADEMEEYEDDLIAKGVLRDPDAPQAEAQPESDNIA